MWYYALSNQQHGPVSEADMDRLIAQRIITAQTLVWREGMSDWLPAGQTELASRLSLSMNSGQGLPPMVSHSRSRADSSAVPPTQLEIPAHATARQLMGMASDLMSGRWGLGIGFCLIYGLIEIGVNMIPYIGSLANLLLCGVLMVGSLRFWLTYTRGGEAKIDQLFSAFPLFWKALLAYLLYAAIFMCVLFLSAIPGGILLGIGIPMETSGGGDLGPLTIAGIVVLVLGLIIAVTIVSLILSQVFYILADDPDAQIFESFKRSHALMIGNKWRLFRLQLIFMLLALGCLFTLMIGYLWLVPYMHCTLTCFYESLLKEEAESEAAPA